MKLHADMGMGSSSGQGTADRVGRGGLLWRGVWVAAGGARALQADMRGLDTSRRAVRRAGASVSPRARRPGSVLIA